MINGMLSRFRALYRNTTSFGQSEKPDRREMIEVLERVIERGRMIESMALHDGWKNVAEILKARFDALQAELRKAKISDVVRLQAQLTELEFILDLVPEAIEESGRASEALEAMMAEDQSDE